MTTPYRNGPIRTRRPLRRRTIDDTPTADRSHAPSAPVEIVFVATPRTFRQSVAYFTQLLGHPLRTTGSVRAALALLRHEAVDIVVIDDVLDARLLLANRQQHGWNDLLVIVMTVVVTEADRDRWLTAGAYACLDKPFTLGAYRQALERAVAETRTRRSTSS